MHTVIHSYGWNITIKIPAITTSPIGISVHRFFRGITCEVQSLWKNIPYPLEPSKFVCLILSGTKNAPEIYREWQQQTKLEEKKQLKAIIKKLEERIEIAKKHPIPSSFLPLAFDLAKKRLNIEVAPVEMFLCWNEAHFLHAMLDLWEITQDKFWLTSILPRIEKIWEYTGTAKNTPDPLWKKPLPTWYNTTETGSACTLVSGAILWPITRLIKIVYTNPLLSDILERATKWLKLARQVIECHDKEWIDFKDGSGMHLEPYLKGPQRMYPRGGSRINPLNREFFLSLPMLNIYAITHEPEYLSLIHI